MADPIKRIARIVALVEISGPAESDINVLGGNLARQLKAAIPTQFDVKGVELESVYDAEEGDKETTSNTSRAKGERDDGKAKATLTT